MDILSSKIIPKKPHENDVDPCTLCKSLVDSFEKVTIIKPTLLYLNK